MKVLATLKDGASVESEFEKLTGIRQLSADVFAGRKAFPVWRTISTVHPATGEPCWIRTREFVNGSEIASLQVLNEDGTIRREVRALGRFGTVKLTAEQAEATGLDEGTVLPLHRDEEFRRFVYTRWTEEESERGIFYLDPAMQPAGMDARDEDEDDDWDDEDDF